MLRRRLRLLLVPPLLALIACLAEPKAEKPPAVERTPLDLCAEPGHVSLHRLNRAEYNNTVRDLLGDATRPADDFPADDSGYGFDNIADVLAVAPLLVEKLDIAAENLAGDTLQRAWPSPTWQHFDAKDVGAEEGARFRDSGWIFLDAGQLAVTASVSIAGTYAISVRAFARRLTAQPVHMELRDGGAAIAGFDVEAEETKPAIYEKRIALDPGVHAISVAFTNPQHRPDPNPDRRDAALILEWIEIGGPFDPPPDPDPERRARIMTCDPGTAGREACARSVLSAFGRRAWRRPLVQAEIDRLVALASVPWTQGDTFDAGVELAMQAVLLSPNFVYRVELDPDPDAPTPKPHPLDDHELAARLSYFLWSSTPDDALLAHADKGDLSSPEVLASEVKRMLSDPKAGAMVDNFGGQWLNTRALSDVNPDYTLFPSWDHDLQVSMETEAKAFLRGFVFDDKSALDMLDAPSSYSDPRLARHYGQEGFRRGLLGLGSILTVTSHPRRTSPVKRGKWVLDQLLCEAPPPPPPGIPPFPEQTTPTGSVRQLMEEHRKNPVCKSCHGIMDPIGFGLENYDAIGAWRTNDSGFPIDASGMLPDGRTFSGPEELAGIIKADPGLPPCLTQRVFIYALGRGPTDADTCSLSWAAAKFTAGDHRLSALLEAIAETSAFGWRHGEGGTR